MHRFDEALRSHHQARVLIGLDEVGRGPLAGPVVAAAVAFDAQEHPELLAVRDSKLLTCEKREFLYSKIRSKALGVAVGWADHEEIDSHNIFRASLLAMKRAVDRLRLGSVDGVLAVVDGTHTVPGLEYPQKALVKGDAHSMAIAAASIIAKVVRDRWMERLDKLFPGYGFAVHRGYATSAHIEALARLGPSPIHRRSFESVRQSKLPLS